MTKVTKEMLVKAESIFNLTKVITYGDITNFELLLEQYEDLENLINDHNTMPHVDRFNPTTDVFTDMWGISTINKNGKKKINLISIKCEQFLKINNSIQKSSNKPVTTPKDSTLSNNSSKIQYVIELIVLVFSCGLLYTIGYNQGANSKEKELYDERDSLKQENIEFQKNITTLNDSITNLHNYLDTLRNIASIKKTLNDSLSTLSTKNKGFEDSLKKTNQKIDSLKHENQRISDTYTGMWSLFQQAEKSLKKCQKQCMKN